MTRDANNRWMYTKNTGRARPIKRTMLKELGLWRNLWNEMIDHDG